MNFLPYIFLLISLIILLLGNYVYYQNRKNNLCKIFFFSCFCVFAYSFSQFMQFQTNDYKTAYMWIKLAGFTWVFSLAATIHFILIFTEKDKFIKKTWILTLIYGLATLVFLIATISPIELIRNPTDGFVFKFKSLLPFIFIHVWGVGGGLITLAICLQFLLKTSGKKKNQAKYVFIGILSPEILGAIGGTTQQLNVVLPHLNALGLSLMAIFIGYAILRYELFEINPRMAADNIISVMFDSLILFDWRGNIVNVNKATLKMLGYRQEDLFGKSVNILFKEDRLLTGIVLEKLILEGRIENFEMTYCTKTSKPIPVLITLSAVKDKRENIVGVAGVAKDITERKRAEAIINRMAYFDLLTNIPNRRLFLDRLNNTIANAKRRRITFALLYFDLDKFKDVNDTFGHEAGDLLLKSTADRLKTKLREADTIARMGGDEFSAILSTVDDTSDVYNVAHKILEILSEPFKFKDNEIHTTASIGISIYPTDGGTIQELLSKADTAMYQAKNNGGNNYRFYDETMSRKAA